MFLQKFQTITPKKNEKKHLINPLPALKFVLNKKMKAVNVIKVELKTMNKVFLLHKRTINAKRKYVKNSAEIDQLAPFQVR